MLHMSADYWLEWPDGGGCPRADHRGPEFVIPMRVASFVEPHGWNITYNLGPMLREAGFPPWVDLKGAPCSEAAGPLLAVLTKLAADPPRFEAMNPPNGWGDYRDACFFIAGMQHGVASHPDAVIGAWL